MSFRWFQFLIIAEIFLVQASTSPNSEALLRSAISRAYYAAFNLAQQFIADKDGVIFAPDSDVHSKIGQYFIMSSNLKRRRLGYRLRNLRKLRNRADYANNFPNLLLDAGSAVADARAIIAALSKM